MIGSSSFFIPNYAPNAQRLVNPVHGCETEETALIDEHRRDTLPLWGLLVQRGNGGIAQGRTFGPFATSAGDRAQPQH